MDTAGRIALSASPALVVARTESMLSVAEAAVEPQRLGWRVNPDEGAVVGAAAAAAKTWWAGAEGVFVLSARLGRVDRIGVWGAGAAVPAAAVLAEAAESATPTLAVSAACPVEREGFLLFHFSGDVGQKLAFRCDCEIPEPAQVALVSPSRALFRSTF